jgi:MOSC domain-containing protein YiiM
MICIHTLLIGQPQTLTDEQGTWRSAIYRQAVSGPIELGPRGLAGDRVADTRHHGSPDQAVCCHPLAHYAYWNEQYGLEGLETALGPGSVGENWTVSGAVEAVVFIGDVYRVGSATVQVSGPRYPCSKQERKLKLPGFLRRTKESMRTGWYLRVLAPGVVAAGDAWRLLERPRPTVSVHDVNRCILGAFDPLLAREVMLAPELAEGWREIVRHRLDREESRDLGIRGLN